MATRTIVVCDVCDEQINHNGFVVKATGSNAHDVHAGECLHKAIDNVVNKGNVQAISVQRFETRQEKAA